MQENCSMNHFLNDLERIRNNGHEIVLYGYAKLAKRLLRFLELYSINVSLITVDQEYIESTAVQGAYRVVTIDECMESGNAYNYIVGFNSRGNAEAIIKKLKDSSKSILLYDFGYGTCEDIHNAIAFYDSLSTCYSNFVDEIYSWLEDEISVVTLRDFIKQKQTGTFGLYGRHFTENQYFPDDVITMKKGETFVDCGAYTGDTVTAFLDKLKRDNVPGYRAIYALEPTPAAFERLAAMSRSLDNCFCFQKGVWDQEETLPFNVSGRESIIHDSGSGTIDLVPLDSLCDNVPVSFIKMDVEGAELKALRGAVNVIKKNRPTLAICIYHKPEDIITIPRFIKSLHPDYKLYVRGHSRLVTNEFVLYAV